MHSQENARRLPSTININLKEERARIDFDQEQLANIVWGGAENLNHIRKMMNLFSNDPILKNTHFYYEMTREEKMAYNYEKLPRIYEKSGEDITYKNIFNYVLVAGSVSPFISYMCSCRLFYITACSSWLSGILVMTNKSGAGSL